VTRAVEGIDRGSLHVSPPRLPTDRGVAAFGRCPRGETCAAAALLVPRSTAFRAAVARCVAQEPIPLITGAQGPRNDAIAPEHHARSRGDAGSVVVGQARETTPVFRAATRGHPDTGRTDPWSVRTTALVNPFDGDGRDDDLGACFITSRTAFPDHAQLRINGPEDRKRPLAKEGSAFEARDHGIPTRADPRRRQPLRDGPSAAQIESPPRQWRQRLPPPFTATDRAAGDRDDLSILPAECAPTQVRDRPPCGRAWCAAVRRANRDSGGPDPVPPRCDRRLTRRTPGRCRTRARTAGVTPSRPLDDTHSRLQQEHQEGRAPADRDDAPRHARLRQRQPADPPARLAADRRSRPPTSPGRPTGQPGPRPRRRRVPPGQGTGRGRGTTGPGVACRRPGRARARERVVGLPSVAPRVLRRRPAGTLAPPEGRAAEDLTSAPRTDPPRRLRRHGWIERIPGTDRDRATREGGRTARFLRPYGEPDRAPRACPAHSGGSPGRLGMTPSLRSVRGEDRALDREGEGASVKLDSFAMSSEVQVT
jgi:hypothetical protein